MAIAEARLPPNLSRIPPELQSQVLGYLEWDDILNLRQVSKYLYNVSRARSIWLQLFKRYSIAIFPKPFPLPRPLQYCSADTLESLIRGYLLSLQRPPQRVVRCRHFSAPHLVWYFHMLPGGQWVLLVNRDGSLSFVDFSGEDLTASPLTPSPWKKIAAELDVTYSVDVKDDSETLTFNVALALREDKGPGRQRQEVYIWSVGVEFDENYNALGLSATLLSTFPEDPYHELRRCSLRGNFVAYQLDDTVFVVDWRKASGTSQRFPRRVFYRYLGDYYVVSERWLLVHFNGDTKLLDITSAPIFWTSSLFESPGKQLICVGQWKSSLVRLHWPWLKRYSKQGNDVFILPTRNEHQALLIPQSQAQDAMPTPSLLPLGATGKHSKTCIPTGLSFDYRVSVLDHRLHFRKLPWFGAHDTQPDHIVDLGLLQEFSALHCALYVDVIPTRVLLGDWRSECVFLELV
ncbi:hypothetical protein BKA70DRAFT_123925 [Coprinopsis sp. MPI-PUGE-AT-0042]|nr:hypothetical protein BKA70DRAFT_123925 [Coprinopsis sp. MPI-PUGE-AT-0042]